MDDGPGANGGPGRKVAGAVRIAPLRRRYLRAVVRIEEDAYPRPWSANLFLSELAQRSSRRYIVGSIGPIVVGYAGLMIVDDEGHVTTLTVDPGWHHRGIGTVLLLDLARSAPGLGVKHLTLEVRVGNDPAQALYRRFGFAPVGVRKNYYAETGEDAIIMWVRDIDGPEYAARLADIEAHLESDR
ncbi:MAG TPA: ribosomal protein S18-alanine N-acetyltransferase [Acidimicrobiales bacterium]|nr:ribosomal protein S18-alanine N-acetyltransferase [Acidimicrobiales bacterium]